MDEITQEMIESDARRIGAPTLFLMAALAAVDCALAADGFAAHLWAWHAAALVAEAGLDGATAFCRLGFERNESGEWTGGAPEPHLGALRTFITRSLIDAEGRTLGRVVTQ